MDGCKILCIQSINLTRQFIYGKDCFRNNRLDILNNDPGNDKFSELNQRFNEIAINESCSY
ncbi:MAG: hypothetical protein GX957_03375 [Clostridiaceae bacterium]|nr:hypothetical protein [Clostridiaceae bacterium]